MTGMLGRLAPGSNKSSDSKEHRRTATPHADPEGALSQT